MTKTKKKTDKGTISKKEFLAAQYEVIVVPDRDEDDPGFIAKAAELSGLLGYGATGADAITDFENVKSGWYDSAMEMNVPVPMPKTDDSAEYSGKFVVRMSPELHQTISKIADESEMSLNTYIVQTLRHRVKTPELSDDLKTLMQSTVRETLRRELNTMNSSMNKYTAAEATDVQGFSTACIYTIKSEAA